MYDRAAGEAAPPVASAVSLKGCGTFTALCPPGALTDPLTAAPEFMKALVARANFIPGTRHHLGWRGVRECACSGALPAWTARVDGLPGVFGLRSTGAEPEAVKGSGAPGDISLGTFLLSYFPHPDEKLAADLSVPAGMATQHPDFMHDIREFPRHRVLSELFTMGVVELRVHTQAPAFSLSLQALPRHIVIADSGVIIERGGQPFEIVPPGGTEQNFPAWDTAYAFFRVLAASASFCTGTAPEELSRAARSGRIFHYDGSGRAYTETAYPADLPEERLLCLGYGLDCAPAESGDFPWNLKTRWRQGSDIPVPDDFADEAWWSPAAPGAATSVDRRALGVSDRPRLLILTGFLGSGKTTFLQRFIEHQVSRNAFTAVIQNEIGATGLDGKLLGEDYAVTEMDEGCVCCSLAGNLKAALGDILSRFQPDFVVLETTGLANPANLIAELADTADIVDFDSVTTVLDGENAETCLNEYGVARAQVENADIILLNKRDLLPDRKAAALTERIRALNPRAPIIETSHGDVNPALLYGVNMRREEARRRLGPALRDLRTHDADGLSSILVPLGAPLDRAAFEERLKGLPDFIFRLKGIVNFHGADSPSLVQYVGGRYGIVQDECPDVPDRFLVLIGTDMERYPAEEFLRGLQ